MSLYYFKTADGQRGVKRGSPRLNPRLSQRLSKPLNWYEKAAPHDNNIAWSQPVFYNPLVQPFAHCLGPTPYENTYQPQLVPYGLQVPMSDSQPNYHPIAGPPTPMLTPTLDPVNATKAITHLNLSEPSIPLPAAANQLYTAVSQAITFFDHFYRSFRTSVGNMRAFGDKNLLNKIWETQIRASMVDPSKDWAIRDNENNQGQGQSQDNNQLDRLSFPQHQKRILERNEALLRSQYSSVPRAAAQLGTSDWPDRELQQNQQRHRAAEALKRKVKSAREELGYTLGAMATDYEMAKMAIRELKCLKQNLVTYRACWKSDWDLEDDDGNDSDIERDGGDYDQQQQEG